MEGTTHGVVEVDALAVNRRHAEHHPQLRPGQGGESWSEEDSRWQIDAGGATDRAAEQTEREGAVDEVEALRDAGGRHAVDRSKEGLVSSVLVRSEGACVRVG